MGLFAKAWTDCFGFVGVMSVAYWPGPGTISGVVLRADLRRFWLMVDRSSRNRGAFLKAMACDLAFLEVSA